MGLGSRVIATAAVAGILLVAGCGGRTDDPVEPPGRFVILTASPQAIAADGSEVAELTVGVAQLSGDIFVAGAEVRLSTDRGVFRETGTRSHTVTTSLIPVPSAGLMGDGTTGTARVTGSYRGTTGFVEVTLL